MKDSSVIEIEDTDYRIFTKGQHKSHIYIAGEKHAICGSQTLRHRRSDDLPELKLNSAILDMCSNCADRLWTDGFYDSSRHD